MGIDEEYERRMSFCDGYSERALMYYSLNHMDLFYVLMSKIDTTDFLDPQNMILFSHLKDIYNHHKVKAFDYDIVRKIAHDDGTLSSMGGERYLSALYGMPISVSNFDEYLNSVLDRSRKFKLSSVLKITENKLSPDAHIKYESASLVSELENSLLNISVEGNNSEDPKELSDGIEEFIEARRNKRVSIIGIPTWFPILDKQIDGLVNGTVFIVAARKKMGKSTFLTNTALNIAVRSRYPVLYLDTEMCFDEFRPRVLAILSQLPERVVLHGGYTDKQYDRLMMAAKILNNTKLFYKEVPGFNVDQVVSLFRRFKMTENIKAGIFDYIKEPATKGGVVDRKEYQLLGDVTTRLKDLARVLNIPLMAAVQLNRDGDVASSDRIAWFGDVIAFWMYRTDDEIEAKKEGGTFKLVIKDSRRGGSTPEEGIGYWFSKKRSTIVEVKQDKQLVDYSDDVVNHGSSDDEEYTQDWLGYEAA